MPRKPATSKPAKPTRNSKPDLSTVAPTKTIVPQEIRIGTMKLCLLGRSPFLFHKKSMKAWQTLLLPGSPSRKRIDRIGILKHVPIDEFRESVYRTRNPRNPTLLQFPASAFRLGAQTAALDMPGLAKTEVGRWIVVEGGARDKDGRISPEIQNMVNMYGVPQITLDMVRNLGQTRVPDVRCKAILPEWACEIYVSFAQPNLNRVGVVNLFSNAGILSGAGDGRQERGKLSYGLFRVVDPDHPEFKRLKAQGGRVPQQEAMEHPEPFSEQTEELLAWFDAELARRQQSGEAPEIEEDELVDIEEC